MRTQHPRETRSWRARLRHPATWLFIGGFLLGSLAILASDRITMQPPVPASPWDTRMCLLHPSSETCDGKYPVAPPALSASQKRAPAGNGACLTAEARIVASASIAGPEHVGTVDLWWSPRCQSSFTHVTLAGDGYLDLSADLQVFYPGLPHDSWHQAEAYTATSVSSATRERSLWSVLIYSPSLPAQGCGYIAAENHTLGACTDWYQAGRHVGVPQDLPW